MKFVRETAGLFVWGFDGTVLTRAHKILLKKLPPAGLILFRRNIKGPRQVKSLVRGLESAGGGEFLIGIDEEGGRVRRLPESYLGYPPAETWGTVYREEGPNKVFEAGRRLARKLLSLGINTDFAPVLDVNSNAQNPIIGDRAFSEDPEIAADAALSFWRGMRSAGLIGCGKHFPGHGDTKTDSHRTLPRVKRGRAALERVELYPFRRAISAGIPMLMTAHVVYDALDKKLPATLSPKILSGLLRRRMEFKGVVVSDDLQMKAVSKKYSEAEAAISALDAGCDLLLVCRGWEEIGEKVIVSVAREIAKTASLRRRMEEALGRISRLKRRYLDR